MIAVWEDLMTKHDPCSVTWYLLGLGVDDAHCNSPRLEVVSFRK